MNKNFFIDPTADLLPAKEDQIFKSLLTREEPESKIILMDLISSIIGRRVTDVVVKNNEPATTDVSQKQERLDINCVIDNDEIVDIEMQANYMMELVDSNHKNLKNKSVYYGCDLLSSQSIKGKSYDKLVKTYQITFVAYTVFPNKDVYRTDFKLRDETGEILTDDLSIIFIELSKMRDILKKPVDKMTPLEMWSIFFEFADDPKYRKVVNEIIGIKEEIQMASTLLQSISKDDVERAKFLSRRKFENDIESDRNTAFRKGKIEGETNRAIEIAKNLFEIGIDTTQISKATGLTINQIEEYVK